MYKYLALGCLLFAGCTNTPRYIEQTDGLDINPKSKVVVTYILKDTKNQQEYIIVRDAYHGGISVTPRLK